MILQHDNFDKALQIKQTWINKCLTCCVCCKYSRFDLIKIDGNYVALNIL